jgi:type VI secretion system protein ImpL
MLSGDQGLVDELAPKLRRSAVLQIGNVVLMHACPDGIDPAAWHREIARLRRRRPLDAIVWVASESNDNVHEPLFIRTISSIFAAVACAAPLFILQALRLKCEAQHVQPVGVLVPQHKSASMQSPIDAMKKALMELEQRTADMGILLCGERTRQPYLAEFSSRIGAQQGNIVARWTSYVASMRQRVPLGGVMFAPLFAEIAAASIPAPAASESTIAPLNEYQPEDRGKPVAQHVLYKALWERIGDAASKSPGQRLACTLSPSSQQQH